MGHYYKAIVRSILLYYGGAETWIKQQPEEYAKSSDVPSELRKVVHHNTIYQAKE
jgi:hypothetical protein